MAKHKKSAMKRNEASKKTRFPCRFFGSFPSKRQPTGGKEKKGEHIIFVSLTPTFYFLSSLSGCYIHRKKAALLFLSGSMLCVERRKRNIWYKVRPTHPACRKFSFRFVVARKKSEKFKFLNCSLMLSLSNYSRRTFERAKWRKKTLRSSVVDARSGHLFWLFRNFVFEAVSHASIFAFFVYYFCYFARATTMKRRARKKKTRKNERGGKTAKSRMKNDSSSREACLEPGTIFFARIFPFSCRRASPI